MEMMLLVAMVHQVIPVKMEVKVVIGGVVLRVVAVVVLMAAIRVQFKVVPVVMVPVDVKTPQMLVMLVVPDVLVKTVRRPQKLIMDC